MKQLSLLLLFFGIFLNFGCNQNLNQSETTTITSPETQSNVSASAEEVSALPVAQQVNNNDPKYKSPLMVVPHSDGFKVYKELKRMLISVNDNYSFVLEAKQHNPFFFDSNNEIVLNQDNQYQFRFEIYPTDNSNFEQDITVEFTVAGIPYIVSSNEAEQIASANQSGYSSFTFSEKVDWILIESDILTQNQAGLVEKQLNFSINIKDASGQKLGMLSSAFSYSIPPVGSFQRPSSSVDSEPPPELLVEDVIMVSTKEVTPEPTIETSSSVSTSVPVSTTAPPIVGASDNAPFNPAPDNPSTVNASPVNASPVRPSSTSKSTVEPTSSEPEEEGLVLIDHDEFAVMSPPGFVSDEQEAAGEISGRLIEYFADTMEVGKMSRIIVEISPDTSEAGLQMEIQQHSTLSKHEDEITTTVISGIGEEMVATLKGDKNHFEIEAMTQNSLRKLDLTSDKFIRWEWDVRPLSSGDHELSLVLERMEGDASDPVPILTKSVTVMVQKTFLRSYGAWIGGLFVVLLGGGFFFYKKRRNQTKQLVFKHKDQVFTLVGQNKTEKALTLLETTFANEHIHDEITMIKARFNDTKEKGMKGVLDHDTFTRERNKVNNDILELMKSFD